jgi:hypothetical protein
MINLKNLKHILVNMINNELNNTSKVTKYVQGYDKPYESEIFSCLPIYY